MEEQEGLRPALELPRCDSRNPESCHF